MGKEHIFRAFKREKTDRTPWVPFVGCHGGKLIGVDAENYLKSSTHMVNGLHAAIEKYRPDGIPVVFDLQIEAEALGCELKWSESSKEDSKKCRGMGVLCHGLCLKEARIMPHSDPFPS